MRRFFSSLFIGLIAISFPIKTTYAEGSVVINEFLVDPDSSQWVELYNRGDTSTDISNWSIDDNGGSQKFTIPQGSIINPSEFIVFESSSFNLNRTSSDEVRLLNGDTLIDNYSYQTGPGANNSYGRAQDGLNTWAVFTSITKSSTNNSSTPLPTPSPTPEPTPTPTKVPTPTKTPTPSKTPTLSKAGSATYTPTPRSVSKNSKSTAATKNLNLSGVPTSTLGESSKSAEKKPDTTDESKNKKVLVDSANQNNFRYIVLSVGIIAIACAILIFLKARKNQIS